MNLEQREHQICEIIRRVCERNNVGVEFMTEPDIDDGYTTVQAVYDLGRERRREERRRSVAIMSLPVIVCGIALIPSGWVGLVACGVLGGCFGTALHRAVRPVQAPNVSQRLLDQEIAFMLAMHGCIVMQSGNRMQIHLQEE